MSFDIDPCERCGARVRQRGDHTCPPCAEALGRDVRDPFWGAFPNHPDAALWPQRLTTAEAA